MFSDAYYSQKINHLSDNKMDLFVLTDVDFFKKMGQPRPLFRLFWVFFKQTLLQFLQQINVKNIMSIQYTAPGFGS